MSWVDTYYALDVWADITPPIVTPDTEWGTRDMWARSTAETVLLLRGQPHRWLANRRLAKQLLRAYDVYAKQPLGKHTYIHLGNLRQQFLPVTVSYGPAEGDKTRALRRLARAD